MTTPHNELKTLDPCIFVELLSAAYTDKKEKEIFLIYQEMQNGLVAQQYMSKGLLIYGSILAHFLIYYGSPSSCMTFATDPILIYMRKVSLSFFISLTYSIVCETILTAFFALHGILSKM